MRNIFSFLILISLSKAAFAASTPKSEAVEPEILIAACAADLDANSTIRYFDEFGAPSLATLGKIVVREVNRHQVLVQKRAPVIDPSELEIKVSNDSPFIHDFQAPADYFPGARIYGVDWQTTTRAYVQSILKVSAHNPKTGSTYYFTMQSGEISVVAKTTTATSPFDVRYVTASNAKCAPWFDQKKNGSFYDLETRPVR